MAKRRRWRKKRANQRGSGAIGSPERAGNRKAATVGKDGEAPPVAEEASQSARQRRDWQPGKGWESQGRNGGQRWRSAAGGGRSEPISEAAARLAARKGLGIARPQRWAKMAKRRLVLLPAQTLCWFAPGA